MKVSGPEIQTKSYDPIISFLNFFLTNRILYQVRFKQNRIKELEADTANTRTTIDRLTNKDQGGTIDRLQTNLNDQISKLQGEIADLHINLKNTQPKSKENRFFLRVA